VYETESDQHFVESITGFYLENLPQKLLNYFVSQKSVLMSLEALPAFAAQIHVPGVKRTRQSLKAMENFFDEFSKVVDGNPQGSFVRLGSRSPKDASGFNSMKVVEPSEALQMCALSERICKDIHWNLIHSYPPTFFVRPWMEVEPWREFRCLVREGKIYGISQYYCRNEKEFSEIGKNLQKIADELYVLMRETVIPAAPHDEFACDVYYSEGNSRIIDYNPFNAKTGLCFFGQQFAQPVSQEIRLRHKGKVTSLSLSEEKVS
jgi:hypothetical protein